jgi:hypothetical protein
MFLWGFTVNENNFFFWPSLSDIFVNLNPQHFCCAFDYEYNSYICFVSTFLQLKLKGMEETMK